MAAKMIARNQICVLRVLILFSIPGLPANKEDVPHCKTFQSNSHKVVYQVDFRKATFEMFF